MVDADLRRALQDGHLIERGTWDASCVKHSSYILRVGYEVEYPHAGNLEPSDRHVFHGRRLGRGESVEIPPGSTALVKPIERFRLPDSVVAFTIPRGFLFAEELIAASSYVDPGFSGHDFYIPIINTSDRLVRIPAGTPIVRVFFVQLGRAVENPYIGSATTGLVEEMESLPVREALTVEQCRQLDVPALLKSIREMTPAGSEIAELLERARTSPERRIRQLEEMLQTQGRRIRRFAFWLGISSIAWPCVVVLAILSFRSARNAIGDGAKTILSLTVTVLLGVASIAVWELIQNYRRRKAEAERAHDLSFAESSVLVTTETTDSEAKY
jgi:deoxycytidine triphosphate deaminase